MDAETLAKENDRDALIKMAKDAGPDGNDYMDKEELARAILEQKPQNTGAGTGNMDNVTLKKLERIHGDKAESVFREIADRGGFGSVGEGEGSIDLHYPGGLDIGGVLDPSNTAVTEASKARIAELAGASQAKAEAKKDGK